MKKILIFTMFILVIIMSFNIFIDNKSILAEDIFHNFITIKNDFFSNSSGYKNIINKLTVLDNSLKEKEKSFEKFYLKARIYFMQAEVYVVLGNKEQAIKKYESAQEMARKAIEIRKNSEIYRILGDTYIRLLSRKGAFFAIRNGQKTFDIVKKAIELNNKNYKAYNSLGRIYLEAPKVGGGDVDKSIDVITKALKSNDKIENFMSYYLLTRAYNKLDNEQKAEMYFEKAENIYKDNYYIQKLNKLIYDK